MRWLVALILCATGCTTPVGSSPHAGEPLAGKADGSEAAADCDSEWAPEFQRLGYEDRGLGDWLKRGKGTEALDAEDREALRNGEMVFTYDAEDGILHMDGSLHYRAEPGALFDAALNVANHPKTQSARIVGGDGERACRYRVFMHVKGRALTSKHTVAVQLVRGQDWAAGAWHLVETPSELAEHDTDPTDTFFGSWYQRQIEPGSEDERPRVYARYTVTFEHDLSHSDWTIRNFGGSEIRARFLKGMEDFAAPDRVVLAGGEDSDSGEDDGPSFGRGGSRR